MSKASSQTRALSTAVVHSLRWTALNAVGITGLYLLQIIVLGRLLSPAAFGLMALALIVVEIAKIYAQLGLSEAIIAKKYTSAAQLSSLYWVNVVCGFALFALLYILAPLIAGFFEQPELEEMIRWLALMFPVAGFTLQFEALLRKDMRFDFITIPNISAALIGAITTITLALYGYGMWSMVWGQLAQQISKSCFLFGLGIRMRWLPTFHFNFAAIKGHLGFGSYRAGAMSINQLNARIDQLVIGAMLGPVALGVYYVAYNFVVQPVQMITPILTQVAFPAFSKTQDNKAALKTGYLKMVAILSFINAPMLFGFAAIAPKALLFMMGEQWAHAVPILQILAFYAFFRSLGNASGSLLLAMGKAKWTFYWNIFLLLFIPASVVIAITLGKTLVSVALMLAIISALLLMLSYALLLRKLIGHFWGDYLVHIGRSFVCALGMAGCVYLMQEIAIPPLWSLVSAVMAGALIYAALSALLNRQLLMDCLVFLSLKKPSPLDRAGTKDYYKLVKKG